MRKRSIIYVDGFNLYFGALRGTRNKWLNLQQFFDRRRSDDDVLLIRYFTALVNEPQRKSQLRYLAALDSCDRVEINLGVYKHRTTRCGVPDCHHCGSREFLRPEEKQTDVSIAVKMLDDAYQGLMQRIVVVSGDSDLVPALELIRSRFPEIEISILVPSQNPARFGVKELRDCASNPKRVRALSPHDRLLQICQFPNPAVTSYGENVWKPVHW
jgi:6-hydroxy-3-succinoylpyridine 3-monooxygenase